MFFSYVGEISFGMGVMLKCLASAEGATAAPIWGQRLHVKALHWLEPENQGIPLTDCPWGD